ncbi:MAG: type 4a pilus biogenesis protein PilO [Candidatus Omnitrophica bacterium]|nr:type 4a pilus biogenesis protein PilO [Candidatus Omnitrophota bacterium]
MDPKEKQKLMVLFAIFGIVGLMVYYNLLLKPQFAKFIVANREFYEVRARVRNADILIASEDRIKKQHLNLSEQVGNFEKRLARQDQISALLQDFSSIAESSGVRILRVMPLDPARGADGSLSANGFYSEFPILIEAMAGYHQCGTFINKLENIDRFIRVDDVDIKGGAGDPRHQHIKLRVSAYIAE